MQLKKIKTILLGRKYKHWQDGKVWKLYVEGGMSAVFILELEGLKGYLGRESKPEGIEFQYLA